LNQEAFATFKQSLGDELSADDPGGKTGQIFCEGLQGVDGGRLANGLMKRSDVFALAADPDVNTITVCAAALAWGGMNMRFRDDFFKLADSGWLDIAERIRLGKMCRRRAYKNLARLRNERLLHGAGPAYFTKLIYFLLPRNGAAHPRGYIMDQWAGCSINLLLSKELVRMDVVRKWKPGSARPNHTFIVSDANTGDEYEQFCNAVDDLVLELNEDPDEIDRALVAKGGSDKSSWRRYVIENRAI
tara:strand:- start:1681 stop:2415 length:735 start_codon:yes stop_codon:yes gene_type:complete